MEPEIPINSWTSRINTDADVARFHYTQRRDQARLSSQREHDGRLLEKQIEGVDYDLIREAAGRPADERRERNKKRGRPHMRKKFAGVGNMGQ